METKQCTFIFFGPENTTSKHQPKKGNAHAPRKANANKLSHESLPLQLTSIIVAKRFDAFWESVTEAVHVQVLIDVIAATFQALPRGLLSNCFTRNRFNAYQRTYTLWRSCRQLRGVAPRAPRGVGDPSARLPARARPLKLSWQMCVEQN